MKVTKAQAQANRTHIVETASAIFRERGYDGVGIADLMAAAGFTHGGFYKHFDSKADLMAEAASCGFAQSASAHHGVDRATFVAQYLSREHRDTFETSCTFAALSGDAGRQPDQVRQAFSEGIERALAAADSERDREDGATQREARAARIDAIAQMVGALVLSRACPDNSPLADEILDACRAAALSRLSAPKQA